MWQVKVIEDYDETLTEMRKIAMTAALQCTAYRSISVSVTRPTAKITTVCHVICVAAVGLPCAKSVSASKVRPKCIYREVAVRCGIHTADAAADLAAA